jgi:hypothetical protein
LALVLFQILLTPQKDAARWALEKLRCKGCVFEGRARMAKGSGHVGLVWVLRQSPLIPEISQPFLLGMPCQVVLVGLFLAFLDPLGNDGPLEKLGSVLVLGKTVKEFGRGAHRKEICRINVNAHQEANQVLG